jgi:hypothetical protein
MNQNLAKVARAQSVDILSCIQSGARSGLEGMTIDECLTADRMGRVNRAILKTQSQEARMCLVDQPDFAFTGADTVNASGTSYELALIQDMLGSDLEGVVVKNIYNSRISRCQRVLVKAVERCRRAKLDEFNKCKLRGLKDSIFDAMSLRSSCLNSDPRGKIARRCDPESGGIRRTLLQRCGEADLSALFPGCGTDDAGELAACLERMVECRVCLSLAEADNFSPAVCDLLDNRAQDGSCGVLTPAGQCGPGTHWIDGPCSSGLDVLVGTTAAIGIDLDANCTTDLSLTLGGDAVLQRSSPIDRSLHFPGPTDCNGSPCGQGDAHLDVIDTEMVLMSLTAAQVELRAGNAGAVPLSPSLGTVVEKNDPALGDSFFDLFFELEVNGTRLYNHSPVRVQAEVTSQPPEATYLAPTGCLLLYDDPAGGLRVGSLVSLELVTRRCGGNLPGMDEDRDFDGFTACADCNDGDPTVFPGALEVCDFVDNNCDGAIDEFCP